ncbi:ABC transporter permease [Streptomyces hygroscopicus]|uniref:ABC transporter permease n=1 Tax=Streptomyces hygroscopicus TaxID=1912 RepID=UPI000767918A|nr:ABC transporter permease [Streptomyces hygroscopicus]GLV78346.1 hypothetical protein Shyhy02_63460 [Streptomyces hygroscopicus subsp. hygroscopicus]
MSPVEQPRSRHRAHIQFIDLTVIQLRNWRWSWIATTVTGMIAPLITVIGFGSLAERGNAAGQLLVGAIVLAMCFENQNKMASHFSMQRETGALGYFATLPVSPAALVAATSAAFFLLSLPALLLTTFSGAAVLDISLRPQLLLIVVVPAAIIPMGCVGAFIGTYAKNYQQGHAISTALTMSTVMLGGVLVPSSNLPKALSVLRWINPANYAASALRQVLLGPVTGRLAVDLAVLTVLGAVLFFLAERRLRLV